MAAISHTPCCIGLQRSVADNPSECLIESTGGVVAKVKDNARCPVGTERIDESTARVNGAIVVGVLLLSLVPAFRWLQLYLLLDFGIKVLLGFAYSPNCAIAGAVAGALKLPVATVPAAPKRFAGAVAMVFIVAAMASWFALGSATGFYAFTAVFFVCALLESAAGFCVGCFVYGILPAAVSKSFVR